MMMSTSFHSAHKVNILQPLTPVAPLNQDIIITSSETFSCPWKKQTSVSAVSRVDAASLQRLARVGRWPTCNPACDAWSYGTVKDRAAKTLCNISFSGHLSWWKSSSSVAVMYNKMRERKQDVVSNQRSYRGAGLRRDNDYVSSLITNSSKNHGERCPSLRLAYFNVVQRNLITLITFFLVGEKNKIALLIVFHYDMKRKTSPSLWCFVRTWDDAGFEEERRRLGMWRCDCVYL